MSTTTDDNAAASHTGPEENSGTLIRFRVANVRGKGFEMLAMFFGIAPMHTVLEREDVG